jgi:hypothetical protein
MGVKGGKEVTLTPGQTFYEGPDDVHIVGHNASLTKPARFLVFLLKNSGGVCLDTGEVMRTPASIRLSANEQQSTLDAQRPVLSSMSSCRIVS